MRAECKKSGDKVDDHIIELFEKNNRYATTKDIKNANITYYELNRYIKNGVIIRIKQGYYQLNTAQDLDEAALISHMFADGVLCMDTALFHYRYTDRTPGQWHIAVDKDSSKTRFNIDYPFVKPYYIEKKHLEIGAIFSEINGIKVRIYNRERVICDCLRYMSKMDKETFNKAIQGYVADNHKNIKTLIEYSKRFRVYKRMQSWIGVWL